MTILAIGDSFTFGAELPDVPLRFGYHGNDYFSEETGKHETAEPSKYSWPSVLAKKLNTDVVNLGLAGGSNDRVFRLAIRETVKQRYDLVVCAWTSVSRFDFMFNNKEAVLSVRTTPSWKKDFPWMVEFVSNHYNEQHAEEAWLTKAIALQEYFKNTSQPYVFLKAFGTRIHASNLYLEKQIDRSNCIEWDSSMLEWCQHLPIGNDGHILTDGHELVAEKIFTHLQDKK